MGVLALFFGFYNDGKKIKVSLTYFATVSGVNIIQWLFLIYIIYQNPTYINGEFYFALLVTLWTTLFIVNQMRKEYFKSSIYNVESIINSLKDTKKLILVSVGLILTIGGLTGFITYHTFTLLYLATFGPTAFVYGYYHKNGKINITVKYVGAMAATILLQWIVLICFVHQMKHEFSAQDLSLPLLLSMNITVLFVLQFYKSDLTLADLILD
jgi:hypothetical protein